MAENNGEVSIENKDIKHEPDSYVERTVDYPKLIDYGLDKTVAGKLDEIYKTGKLSHEDLDERALDALRDFPVDGALSVLTQFLESNLEHVSNKSAYLCGVMKTYRQKNRGGTNSGIGGAAPLSGGNVAKGPDEDKIKAILDRTGYSLDVTTGQRKYGGPPPGWEGSPPGNGCEACDHICQLNTVKITAQTQVMITAYINPLETCGRYLVHRQHTQASNE